MTGIPEYGPNTEFGFDHDGEHYVLPPFNTIKSGLIRKIRHMDEADAMYSLLEAVCDERTLAATDDMRMDELRDVMLGWQKQAGASLGE